MRCNCFDVDNLQSKFNTSLLTITRKNRVNRKPLKE